MARRSKNFSAPSRTECDQCGKRRWTVIFHSEKRPGPEPHICGQCLANAMKELDRGLQAALLLEVGKDS